MTNFIKLPLFFFLLTIVLLENISAQRISSSGKEFYVAFAQNQGGESFGVRGEANNYFALFITSKVPTKGKVEVTGLKWSTNFTTTPGQITTIELPDGKKNGDPTVEVKTDEQVVHGMAVHITSD